MALYYLEHPYARYFEGDCAAFAAQTARLTLLPLAALIEFDSTLGCEVLIHAFVLNGPDGEIIDAAGESSIEAVISEFPNHGQPRLCLISESELMKLAYGENAHTPLDTVTSDVLELLREIGIQIRSALPSPSK